jgi:hypothetical protein
MPRHAKERPSQKQARSTDRKARLSQALRANLLKRKAQAKNRASSAKDRDEGRQN